MVRKKSSGWAEESWEEDWGDDDDLEGGGSSAVREGGQGVEGGTGGDGGAGVGIAMAESNNAAVGGMATVASDALPRPPGMAAAAMAIPPQPPKPAARGPKPLPEPKREPDLFSELGMGMDPTSVKAARKIDLATQHKTKRMQTSAVTDFTNVSDRFRLEEDDDTTLEDDGGGDGWGDDDDDLNAAIRQEKRQQRSQQPRKARERREKPAKRIGGVVVQ